MGEPGESAPDSTDPHPFIAFYHHNAIDSLSKEESVQLVLKAFNDGQFETKKKAASLVFDVSETTLQH